MTLAHAFLAFLLIFGVYAKALARDTTHKPISIDIELTLPKLNAHPYHKPFVAVWLETQERAPIETIAIWYDDAEWLKDLRQWWRKLGRDQHAKRQLDGLSGATQKPGLHSIKWQGAVTDEDVYINFEVVREEGGRSYHRELIHLKKPNSYSIAKSDEFGEIKIHVNKSIIKQ